MKHFTAVDLFCGGGGTSTGMMMACSAAGIDPSNIDLTAVNHWETAIATHAANHPFARHIPHTLDKIQPERVVPGGRADLIWASPECIHHSNAAGGRPRNDQSRSQAMMVLDWVDRITPSTLLVENVPEFVNWGPLYRSGPKKNKPIPSKRGSQFRAFVEMLGAMNYHAEWRILNCADYGDATTRRRFFMIARRGRKRISWPKQTNFDGGQEDLFGIHSQWKPAREIIDWNIPGHSIFLSREDCRSAGLRVQRPLAQNTMKRIEAGIRKFWGEWAEPFLVLLRGTRDKQLENTCIRLDKPLPALTCGGHVGLVQPILTTLNNWPSQLSGQRIDRPLPTQTTANHFGLIRPFFVRFNGERKGEAPRTHGIDNPVPVIDTSGRYGLCQPFIVPQLVCGANRSTENPIPSLTTTSRGVGLLTPFLLATGQTGRNGNRVRGMDDPLSTLVTKAEQCIVRPFLVKYYGTGAAVDLESPLDTVTADDRFGLVRPILVEAGGERYLLDILFRMLNPAELAAAHSFPSDYIWTGNKSEVVKQIGNSVPVLTASALCLSQIAA